MKNSFLPYLFIFSFFLFTGQRLYAQENKLFTGHFEDLSFTAFAEKIESESPYRFYFQASTVDSVRVTLTVTAKPLPFMLEEIFRNTRLHFTIHRQAVFITREYAIISSLPAYLANKNPIPSTQQAGTLLDAGDVDSADRISANLLENRLFEIGNKASAQRPGNATVAGYIRDQKTGQAVTGGMVYIDDQKNPILADQFGYFSLTLSKGRHVLVFSGTGMKDSRRQILLYSDGKLNVDLVDRVQSLKAVVVLSEKNSNVKRVEMGVERIDIKVLKQVPVVFGEVDVLKVMLSLPGVTSVGEASTGFNVRGGSVDQNLILFNEATIYNPTHLFGFFSAFNPDMVKDVELYKSSIPAKYGGRLSSVFDVSVREGNKKKFSGSGGIGPLTGRLTLEGPLFNEKTSYIVGARSTYSDWLLKNLPSSDYKKSRAGFYDLNFNISHELNGKNNLYVTGYLSKDRFRLNTDTTFMYSNSNLYLRWKHIYNNKIYSVFTAGIDHYYYQVSADKNPVNAFKLRYDINQLNARADFNYSPDTRHVMNFGIQSISYLLRPGSLKPVGAASLVSPDMLSTEKALETALYFSDRFTVTPEFSVEAGIRYSIFNNLGPRDVYHYATGLPRDETTMTDTVHHSSGKLYKTYQYPEFRLSARYNITNDLSLKAAVNTTRQYIHMLSNTTSVSPTDIWKLSDPYIKPQSGQQVSLGIYKNFKSSVETSLEVYYKKLYHFLDYKSGAQLLLNHHIETDVINSRGKAYGAEFMVRKQAGKLNGWISYTFSRTLLQTDDPVAAEKVNEGNYYPANFDKPHNLNVVANYKFSHRFSVSSNISYSTGRPITYPIGIYNMGGSERVFYSNRNEYRIPDYFRTDLSMNIEGNHKIKKLAHSSWTIGVYNLTARKNPYSVYFVSENGRVKGYKLSIFGTMIPFLTYNFKF